MTDYNNALWVVKLFFFFFFTTGDEIVSYPAVIESGPVTVVAPYIANFFFCLTHNTFLYPVLKKNGARETEWEKDNPKTEVPESEHTKKGFNDFFSKKKETRNEHTHYWTKERNFTQS